MKIDGSCHCGAICYEADINPKSVGICHCTDCQIFSGSAFRITAPVPREQFRLLQGTPRIYIKTAESGNQRAQAFCADCGTALYATSVSDPKVYGVRVSTSRQRAQLPPHRQIWCRSALPWVNDLAGIATRIDKQG